MAEISRFYGIVIQMFGNDHNPPHFHVVYNEFRAVVEIQTGKLMEGDLPSKQLTYVLEWNDIHKDELLENFESLRAEVKTLMNWIEKIVNVEPYTVTCLWNDNKIRKTDLTNFISNVSQNDSYHQLTDGARFCDVKCDGTTLYWENGISIKDDEGRDKKGPLDFDPDFLFSLSETLIDKSSTAKKAL